MSTRFVLLVAALAASAAAQKQDPPFYLPEGIKVERNLVYGRAGARDLQLDLFLPASGVEPFPAVVYVHGGGWTGGNRTAFQRQAAHMATKGFAGACIEYRLSGEARFPAAVYDAKAAVRWVRANAGRYGIDPDRIGAAGGSAGGHLVAMLGTTAHLKRFEGDGGNPGASSRVAAVAAFNPVVDIASLGRGAPGNASNAIFRFLGATYLDNPDLWNEATPLNYADKTSAPFLFLHGTTDRTVPYSQSETMMKRLSAAGVHAEIFTAEDAGHGFFNRPPWFEPTLERMEQFFVKLLR